MASPDKEDASQELSIQMGNILTSLLTAPFFAVGICLQTSVRGHKALFSPQSLSQKEGLVKTTTALTLQERRRFELMVRVG